MRGFHRIYGGFLLFFFLISCTNRIVKPPPNFSKQEKTLDDSSIALRSISIEINREFLGLNQGISDLHTLNEMRFSDDFPHDLFKHTLMSCLNKTRLELDGPPKWVEKAQFFGVSCYVLPLDKLYESYGSETNLDQVKKGMASLEKVRQHRFRIQNLLQDISPQVAKIRKDLNIKRGELRRKNDFLKTKRNEYSDKEWLGVLGSVETYVKELDDLQSLTKTLVLNKKLWFTKLGALIDVLYKKIATLGEP